MPFVYSFHSKQEAENFTTSGTPNMEIDVLSVRNSPVQPRRGMALQAVQVQGKAIGLTALTTLNFRLARWTGSDPSGGSNNPVIATDARAPSTNAQAMMGTGGGTAGLINGTGGPAIMGGFGCLASEPGGWLAAEQGGAIYMQSAGATTSVDLFSSSGTPLLNYEFSGELVTL